MKYATHSKLWDQMGEIHIPHREESKVFTASRKKKSLYSKLYHMKHGERVRNNITYQDE